MTADTPNMLSSSATSVSASLTQHHVEKVSASWLHLQSAVVPHILPLVELRTAAQHKGLPRLGAQTTEPTVLIDAQDCRARQQLKLPLLHTMLLSAANLPMLLAEVSAVSVRAVAVHST